MDLIIDGNAFINVAISVAKSMSNQDKRTGDAYYVNDLFNDGGFILKDHVKVAFRNFCFTYLNSLIAPIGPSLGQVHLVFDSKSWRKEYISNFFETSTFKTESAPAQFKYKGNRKYDDHQYLFFDYFQQILTPRLKDECGLNYYRFKGTEGDDIIAYLCEKLNTDILIYSVDQDMKQLVGSPNKNVMLIVPKQMSKHKKLFLPKSIIPEPAASEEDGFFSLNESHITGSTIDKIISSLKSKGYVDSTVDTTDEVLNKVLLGDKSDNIPRVANITPAKAKKIITSLQERIESPLLKKLDELDDSFLEHFVESIKLVLKVKDQAKLDEIREHLLFNIKIIRLSTKVLPDEIQETLDTFFNAYEFSNFSLTKFNELKNNLSEL